MGSVILLSGEPGDPIIELSHIKQPMEPVGPFKILMGQGTLAVTVEKGSDLLSSLRASSGLTVSDAARALYDTSFLMVQAEITNALPSSGTASYSARVNGSSASQCLSVHSHADDSSWCPS